MSFFPKILNAIYNPPTAQIKQDIESGAIVLDTSRVIEYNSRTFLQIPPLQKLLFSATLSSNPTKLVSLKLSDPLFITGTTKQSFILPVNLKQNIVYCKNEEKPLFLIRLLQESSAKQILIFTSQIETAHRLLKLFEILSDHIPKHLTMAEYSSHLSHKERLKLMNNFKAGTISLLICSDVVSRGLDVTNIDLVINYDPPNHITTYIHRVGRTARAGREGTTYTLLDSSQRDSFRIILKKAINTKQTIYKINRKETILPLLPTFQSALWRLEEVLEREKKVIKTKTNIPTNLTVESTVSSDIEIIRKFLKQKSLQNFT